MVRKFQYNMNEIHAILLNISCIQFRFNSDKEKGKDEAADEGVVEKWHHILSNRTEESINIFKYTKVSIQSISKVFILQDEITALIITKLYIDYYLQSSPFLLSIFEDVEISYIIFPRLLNSR